MAESSRPHALPSLVLGAWTRAIAILDARCQCEASRPQRFMEKDRVRVGTLLALRAAEVGKLFLELPSRPGKVWPWAIETPARQPKVPSVFKLPEVSYLTSLDDVEIVQRVQCYHGAPSPKPIKLLGTMRLTNLPEKCKHPFCHWSVPWSG